MPQISQRLSEVVQMVREKPAFGIAFTLLRSSATGGFWGIIIEPGRLRVPLRIDLQCENFAFLSSTAQGCEC